MTLKRFNDFINESVNDKYALLDILKEWGVFNPLEFMKYLENLGYTIIELDPVGRGIQEKFDTFKLFEDDEWFDDVYDDEEDRLHNWLIQKGVRNPDIFFSELYDNFGIAIVKDSDWEPIENESKINEYVDVRNKITKSITPTIEETISKLTSIMMDASYDGLRANNDWPDNKEKKHFMFYLYKGKKLLKGIKKLEKKVDKNKNKHILSSEEQKMFNDFVLRSLKELHYRFPNKFKEKLNDFETEQKETFITNYNELAEKYNTKIL